MGRRSSYMTQIHLRNGGCKPALIKPPLKDTQKSVKQITVRVYLTLYPNNIIVQKQCFNLER